MADNKSSLLRVEERKGQPELLGIYYYCCNDATAKSLLQPNEDRK